MKSFINPARKNVLATTIISVVLILPCKSQKITVGSMVGINKTFLWNKNINGSKDNESTLSTNFSSGAYYGIDGHLSLSKHFDVSLGIVRSNQNQSYNPSYDQMFGTTSSEINTELDYLDIPFLMRFKVKWFYMEAGPQVGFLLKAEEDITNLSYQDVTSSFDPFNLMIDFGTGISWKLDNRFSMTGGIRMGLGLSDITREYSEEEGVPPDASIVTQMAHISVENYYWVDVILGQTNGAITYEDFSYKKTTRHFIGLYLALIYDLTAINNK